MKRYAVALCALAICALLAGCEKAKKEAETTAAPITATVTSAETTTAAPAQSEPEETEISAGTALFIEAPDEERVPFLGWTHEDYEKNDFRLVPIQNDLGWTEKYVISNVVILGFTRAASYEQREEFINSRSDIFEGMIGRQNSNNTITVKLKKPLTEKEVLTQSEYMNEVYPQLDSFKELSPIVIEAFTDKISGINPDEARRDEEHALGEGWSFEDYEKNGIILVPVYSRSGDDEPVFYYMSNVLDLYFTHASTDEEREEFISAHSDIFEEKLGGLKSYRMKQVKLKEPLTDKASLTIEEYYDEICKKAETFAEISPIVFHADTEEYYTNIRLN